MKIGVISDTHGTLPRQVYSFFDQCDEVWHCGDIGPGVFDELRQFKPTRAVYGNIEGGDLRLELPRTAIFSVGGLKVVMTHIGGYPGHYQPAIGRLLSTERPDIFVCGHSHILKIMYDKQLQLLHINPGAAGCYGIHRFSTLVRFDIDGTPRNAQILEFPKFATSAE